MGRGKGGNPHMTAVPSSNIDSSQPIRRQGERKEEQNRLGGAKEIPHNTTAFPSPTVHSSTPFFHSSLHWFIHSFIHFNTAAADLDRRARSNHSAVRVQNVLRVSGG